MNTPSDPSLNTITVRGRRMVIDGGRSVWVGCGEGREGPGVYLQFTRPGAVDPTQPTTRHRDGLIEGVPSVVSELCISREAAQALLTMLVSNLGAVSVASALGHKSARAAVNEAALTLAHLVSVGTFTMGALVEANDLLDRYDALVAKYQPDAAAAPTTDAPHAP